MINFLDQKILGITPPAAIVNNASFTTAEVDSVQNGVKYDWASVYVYLGATDVAVTQCKIQESDTSGSGFVDITGAVLSPTATDDNKFFVFHIDMRKRKRYLDLVLTIGSGTTGGFVTAFAILSRSKEVPSSALLRGANGGEVLLT
jgi:hypothetical protein